MCFYKQKLQKRPLPRESEITMEWSTEDEIQLLFAIDGLKPIGINKHFNMYFISERLSKSLNRDISTETIWTHLRTLYNLDALDEMEPLPFPNDVKDFSLPELEFATLLSKKRAESEEKQSDGGSSTDTSIIKDRPISKTVSNQNSRDSEKKVTAKLQADIPKRSQKRTRGSMCFESSSPSTTPPPILKRRRF